MEANVEETESANSYRTLARALRSAISDGTYPPGSTLPTQASLSHRFTVSRSTVQRALNKLKSEGLVESRGQGRGAVVSGASTTRQAYGECAVMLAQGLADAFQAEHVKIDAYSLSGETLNHAIVGEIGQIRHRRDHGQPIPKSVTVRALLADPESDLLVGAPADNPSDTRTRRRIAQKLRVQASYLGTSMETLDDTGPEPRVSIDIRTLAATPPFKVYLLNNVELLQGHYNFRRRMVSVGRNLPEVAAFDALGSESVLFRFSAAEGELDAASTAFVHSTQAWFDDLWETVAQPLGPAE